MTLAAAVVGYFLGHDSPPGLRVVRFDLSAPGGTSFHLDAASPGPIVVSPDGTTFAFSARTASGEVGLFLRELDAVVARPLGGAEGAQYPFWSPDSQSIGFFADGKLKKIDAAGDNRPSKNPYWEGTGDLRSTP